MWWNLVTCIALSLFRFSNHSFQSWNLLSSRLWWDESKWVKNRLKYFPDAFVLCADLIQLWLVSTRLNSAQLPSQRMQWIFGTTRLVICTNYVYCHQKFVYYLTSERVLYLQEPKEICIWILKFYLREYCFNVQQPVVLAM